VARLSQQRCEQQFLDFRRADVEADITALQLESIWVTEGKSRVRVSAKTLKYVLEKIAGYCWARGVCWASAPTIAAAINCHERTVRRASKGLVDLQLLVLPDTRERGKSKRFSLNIGEINLQAGKAKSSPKSAVATPDIVTRTPDIVTRTPDIVSDDSLRVFKTPPLIQDPWAVVVSGLLKLGMAKALEAVTAAKSRELTVDQVNELTQRWERLRARQPHVTVGWLYRWLMGLSLPPDEPGADVARKPSTSIMADSTRRNMDEIKLRKSLQAAGIRDLAEQDAIVTKKLSREPLARSPSPIGNVFQRPPSAVDQTEIERRRAGYTHALTNS
jgi:hypothetical protein